MNLITKAKEHLIMHHPFFAYLSLQVEFVPDKTVSKSSIDGLKLRYNPKYIETLSIAECAGLIAHAMGHVLLLHPLRSAHKEAKRWDKATDYAVNSILKEANIPLLNDLYDSSLKNKSAESIYEDLKEENDENNTQSNEANDDNGEAGGSDNSSDSNPSGESNSDSGSNEQQETGDFNVCEVEAPRDNSISEAEQELIITQKIMDAAMQSEFSGNQLGAAIELIVDQLKEPKKDWREIFFKFFAEITQNDYDWEMPDLQYLQRNLYVPSLNSPDIGNIIFGFDTSGSVNTKILNLFLSEFQEAAEQIKKEILVIYCDDEVRKVEEVQSEDIKNIKPAGGWGTLFSPVFKYIEDNDLNPKALVYFTDGKCHESLAEPSYPVIWCIYNNKNFVPQFGECIFIDN